MQMVTVATRARSRQLRFLFRRSTFAVARCQGPSSSCHGTWRDIDWLGELGDRRSIKAVFQKEALGQLEYDEGSCGG